MNNEKYNIIIRDEEEHAEFYEKLLEESDEG
jgi:hypothetical protein